MVISTFEVYRSEEFIFVQMCQHAIYLGISTTVITPGDLGIW